MPDNQFCFECHKNTGGLEKCLLCPRVFHGDCLKTEAERQEEYDELNYHKQQFQKNLSSGKSGSTEADDEAEFPETAPSSSRPSGKLCYGCFLLNKGQQRSAPVMSREELNYLVKFAVERVIQWVPTDTKGIKDVVAKVRGQKYSLAEEALVDLLDIQHQVAIRSGRKLKFVFPQKKT